MKQKGYPYTFVGCDSTGADNYLKHTLVYRFESTKSGHKYTVHIECYVEHLHCIKFFDETQNVSFGKFSHLSGTYEPRTIFSTIADIALDAFRRDPNASFVFVGAADAKDVEGRQNRRYRVYTMFLRDLGIDHLFRPAYIDSESMCILLNINAVKNRKEYVHQILEFISL